MRAFVLFICFGIASCGGGSSSKKEEEKFSPSSSFTTTSAGSLPTCDSKMKGALAYVKDEKKFYTCDSTWTVIEIKGDTGVKGEDGQAGMSLASRWRFHVDTFNGQTDLENNSTPLAIYVGDVELNILSDGSSIVMVSGLKLDVTSSPSLRDDYSYMFIFSSTEKDAQRVVKLDSFSNSKLIFKVNTTASTPTFKAMFDNDNNLSNDVEVPYSLTKQ